MNGTEIFIKGEKIKIPDFLLSEFELEADKLIDCLKNEGFCLEDFIFKDEVRESIKEKFPKISREIGFEWLKQKFLLTLRESEKFPCPRSRAWIANEKQ